MSGADTAGCPCPSPTRCSRSKPAPPKGPSPTPSSDAPDSVGDIGEGNLPRAAATGSQVADAFAALQAAELSGVPRRTLDHLEEAYLTEVAVYRAIATQPPAATSDAF